MKDVLTRFTLGATLILGRILPYKQLRGPLSSEVGKLDQLRRLYDHNPLFCLIINLYVDVYSIPQQSQLALLATIQPWFWVRVIVSPLLSTLSSWVLMLLLLHSILAVLSTFLG